MLVSSVEYDVLVGLVVLVSSVEYDVLVGLVVLVSSEEYGILVDMWPVVLGSVLVSSVKYDVLVGTWSVVVRISVALTNVIKLTTDVIAEADVPVNISCCTAVDVSSVKPSI